MKMLTYVNFPGKCAEAFRFYEKQLGGKIGMMMTHGQAPDQSNVKPEWKDAVLHARISIGDTELMGADIPDAQPMRSAYLSLSVDSDAEAERIFSALSGPQSWARKSPGEETPRSSNLRAIRIIPILSYAYMR